MRRTSRRVLVVEDEEDILDLLKTIVEGEGHECLTARSVGEARRICDEREIDVMLLDFVLLDGPGIEVARHVRGKRGKMPAITLISAAELVEWDRETCRKLGIRKVIRKPYRMEDIRDALRE